MTGALTNASGFVGPLTGNVTGNVSGSSGSCTGNAATATNATNAANAHAIDNGIVTPAKLSTGAPSWDASGNLGVAGNLSIGSSGVQLLENAGNPFFQFRPGSYIQYQSSTHKFLFVLDGVVAASIDNGGNLRVAGTVILNTTP